MHEYELMYILHPRLTADETAGAIERVSERVTSVGGEILSIDNWGRRRLAYPIHHHFEGTYVLATMRLPAEATAPLESALRISEDVIRHLLIRGIIAYEGPPMQEERGRSQRPSAGEAEAAPAERPVAAAEEGAASPAEPAEPTEAAEPVTAAEAPVATESPAESSTETPSSENGGSESGSEAEGERAAGTAE